MLFRSSRLERQGSSGPSNLPTSITVSEIRKFDTPEHQSTIGESVKTTEAMHHTEKAAAKEWEQCERDAKGRAEYIKREAREVTGAQEQTEKEAREWAEKAVRELTEAKREAKEQAKQKEKERAERETREKAEGEEREKAGKAAKKKADRKEKEWEEQFLAPFVSIGGSTIGKDNNCLRKRSGLSQKEQKNEWAGVRGSGSTEKKDETSGSPPIVISSIPSSVLDGAGKFDSSDNKASPGAKLARSTW